MTVSAMPASAAVEWPVEARLSTDYLNRYSEALMLIEMAADMPDVVEDLRDWQPIGYRAHFEASQLRCAPSAMLAFDGLDPTCRKAFEELCRTMNRLIATVTALLSEPDGVGTPAAIVDVAGEALRRLIGRATQFINENGVVAVEAIHDRALQNEIDALFIR